MVIQPPEKPIPRGLAGEKQAIDSLMADMREYVH
jgi:hypothetical protein